MSQEYIYGGSETEVDLRDMLFHILHKWRSILLWGLLLCVLLSGIGVIRRMLSDTLTEPKRIREYKVELARYQLAIASCELDLKDYNERLTQQEAYLGESVLMHTDPYAKPVASVDIFVKLDDEEWTTMPSNINVDPTDSLIKMYTSGFGANLDWKPIEELTGGKKLYLMELVNVTSDYNSNTFTINVVHSDPNMAQQILNIILGQIQEKHQNIIDKVNTHTLSALNQSLSFNIDTSLADRQKNGEQTKAEYENALLNCQEKLDSLRENVPQKPFIIGYAKYPIAGVIMGMFLAMFWHSIIYLLNGKLHGKETLKNKYGYPLLGVYPQTQNSKILACIDKYLGKLEDTDINIGIEDACKRIAVNVVNLFQKDGNILITGTASLDKMKELAENIGPYVNSITFTSAANMNRNTKTLELLAVCDGVIIVEEKDKSFMREVQKEHENIMLLNKTVIGYVLM